MLTLVLADSELELVPPQIQRHPAIRSHARKQGKSPARLLLDSSFHHPAMRRLEQGERRGRPDIVHLFMLLCLDSILNGEGKLRTIVHTRNNEMITIAPETRIPKNYTRFVGLMEDLFEKRRVPGTGTPLLTLESGKDLKAVLEDIGGKSVALDPAGKMVDLADFLAKKKGDITMVIGGFPHGEFNSPVKEFCSESISIFPSPLKVWTVAAEVLVNYGNVIHKVEKSTHR